MVTVSFSRGEEGGQGGGWGQGVLLPRLEEPSTSYREDGEGLGPPAPVASASLITHLRCRVISSLASCMKTPQTPSATPAILPHTATVLFLTFLPRSCPCCSSPVDPLNLKPLKRSKIPSETRQTTLSLPVSSQPPTFICRHVLAHSQTLPHKHLSIGTHPWASAALHRTVPRHSFSLEL